MSFVVTADGGWTWLHAATMRMPPQCACTCTAPVVTPHARHATPRFAALFAQLHCKYTLFFVARGKLTLLDGNSCSSASLRSLGRASLKLASTPARRLSPKCNLLPSNTCASLIGPNKRRPIFFFPPKV